MFDLFTSLAYNVLHIAMKGEGNLLTWRYISLCLYPFLTLSLTVHFHEFLLLS